MFMTPLLTISSKQSPNNVFGLTIYNQTTTNSANLTEENRLQCNWETCIIAQCFLVSFLCVVIHTWTVFDGKLSTAMPSTNFHRICKAQTLANSLSVALSAGHSSVCTAGGASHRHWVRSSFADKSLSQNFCLRPDLRPNLTWRHRFGLRPKFGLRTDLSRTRRSSAGNSQCKTPIFWS